MLTAGPVLEHEDGGTRMYSFTKLKRLYNLYKKERVVAYNEEYGRLKEDRMTQRNPLRPWRNYNVKEAIAYAQNELKEFRNADREISSHFDEVVEYFDAMERERDVKISNIEIDDEEHATIELFTEIHEMYVAKTIEGVDISYSERE